MGFARLPPWHTLMVPCRPDGCSTLAILVAVKCDKSRIEIDVIFFMWVTYFLITELMLQKEANQGHGNWANRITKRSAQTLWIRAAVCPQSLPLNFEVGSGLQFIKTNGSEASQSLRKRASSLLLDNGANRLPLQQAALTDSLICHHHRLPIRATTVRSTYMCYFAPIKPVAQLMD